MNLVVRVRSEGSSRTSRRPSSTLMRNNWPPTRLSAEIFFRRATHDCLLFNYLLRNSAVCQATATTGKLRAPLCQKEYLLS